MRNEWDILGDQWERHLRAANRSPATIKTYRRSLTKLAKWATKEIPERSPMEITVTDLEDFFAHQFSTPTRFNKPPTPETVAIDFRQLKVFYNWLSRKEDLNSPFRKMTPPMVPEKPVPVFSDNDLHKLLAACAGKTFANRRDTAIVRLLFDGGIRRAEIAGLDVTHVDLVEQIVNVLGKGRRERKVPYGARTAEALDDYMRARMRHPDRNLPNLWLAAPPATGSLGYEGVKRMLERLARKAGVQKVYAHRFRHTAAHTQLDAGLSEGDAMLIFGWKTRSMVSRYGASAAQSRAIKASRRNSHADRI
jgi:site-specific recombinase XerD